MILNRPPQRKSTTDRLLADPAVARIIARARYIARHDWRGYTRLAAELRRLVGWSATDPDLANPYAYMVAHRLLGDAMGSARTWRYRPAKKQG